MEAITAIWVLAAMNTLLCLVAAGVLQLVAARAANPGALEFLARVLLLAALVLGAATLALTYLTHRLRTVRPPRPVMLVALVIAATPVVTLAALAIVNR